MLETEHLSKTYRHASGRELIPRVVFIDAGGHHSKQVNQFTRARNGRKVFSIFGATAAKAPILGNPTHNNAAKAIQYPIGVFAAKEALIARLEKIETPGPGYIHLPPWLEDEQIQQLTAEKLIEVGDKRIFKKTRARNELTDLWVYGLAAVHQPGPKTVYRLGAYARALGAAPAVRPMATPVAPRAADSSPSMDEMPPPPRAPTRTVPPRGRRVLSQGID